ncbi:MAG: hypothetical protein ABSE56_21385 [Bryobacteraceae bacterium]
MRSTVGRASTPALGLQAEHRLGATRIYYFLLSAFRDDVHRAAIGL